MTARLLWHRLTTIVLALHLFFSIPLSKAQQAADKDHSTAIHWFDGQKKHTVYQLPQILAQFNRTSHPQIAKNLRQLLPSAQLTAQHQGVVFFRVKSADYIKALGHKSLAQPSLFSPTFSYHPRGAPDLALPGGLLVTFEEGLDQLDVERILHRIDFPLDNHPGIKKLNLYRKNAWYIPTPRGTWSLLYTNRLASLEEVIEVSPNWWYKLHHK